MQTKKTILSILMIFVFSAYAVYEHDHADKADLSSLIQGDLSGSPEVAHVVDASAPPADNQAMTPQEFSDYLARINTEAAQTRSNEQVPPPVATSAATIQTVTTRVRDDEEGGDDQNEEGDSLRQQVVAQSATQAPTPSQTQAQLDAAAKQLAQLQAELAARQAAQMPPQTSSIPAAPPQDQQPPAPAQPTQAQGQYRDGTYPGPSVNVYYGYVQVQAIVQGGRITDVQFLDYPQDRRTSQRINSQAMPMLQQEAIQAQSASVDGVSGATATSQGFVQSLSSALSQARS